MFHTKSRIALTLATITAVAALAGCASEPQYVVENKRIAVTPESREWINSHATLVDRDVELAGAAVRQKGTIHALADPIKDSSPELSKAEIENKLQSAVDDLESSENADAAKKKKVTELISRSQANSSISGKSLYEREAWRKYCNEGEGLSASKIKQLEIIGPEKMPADLVDDCQPPSND